MNHKEKISIIIPLYNHEKYIKEAIESVLSQTFPIHEIIIIDDGSTDFSAKVIKDNFGCFNNVKYFYQENSGAHNAINRGIEMSEGEIVAILNSDDVYHKSRIEILADFIIKDNYDVVFSGINFIDKEGNRITNNWYKDTWNEYLKNKDLSLSLINGNFLMTTSNILFKKEVFQKVGGFNCLRYAHDLDFFLRLTLKNLRIKINGEELLSYRIHGSNTIKENHDLVRIEWASIIAKYIMVKKDSGPMESWFIYCNDLFKIISKHNLIKNVLFFMWLFEYLNRVDEEYYKVVTKNKDIINFVNEINK